MKAISLFFSLVFCFSNSIQSQNYFRFLEPDKRWDETLWNWPSYHTVSFIIGEDSVFNDRIYSYLRFKDYDQNDFFNAVFLLREDTINKKVYSVFPAENKEHLLYDFSLEEHDSIWTRSLGYDSMLLVVDSLTTTLVNDQYRKTIVFREETINDPIWIEGIGSIHGPLYPTFSRTVDGGEYLNCVHLGDSLIYQITSDCNNSNTFVTQPVSPNNFIHFYPDQCRFVIEGIITANSLLQIFSINGTLIDQISGDGDIELHLDKARYTQGVFIYRFICEEGTFPGKFVIVK